MGTSCGTAWGICKHDGAPLVHGDFEARICPRCSSEWTSSDVEPCPEAPFVVLDSGFGLPQSLCHWHAIAFLGVTPGTRVISAPEGFDFEAPDAEHDAVA